MKREWLAILIVGLTFGTAWAIRGQFGHEQGAAWAGGIGALALVLVSKRKDWYSKMILIALSSSVGWGAGGMISYGKIVGYGRSADFLNTSYGLVMLFMIGGLFGLLGGGFVGLTLESSDQKRVNWGSLITEMAAGGLIAYSLLIDQLELLMTPPRSEAWAVCFGAGLAMIWYMVRHNNYSSLRVALFSSLGAGFGFAFGNFLQIIGNVLEIDFNMWNVMEYSIGFFGGISMAYGVLSSEWPEESLVPEHWENKTAFFFTFLLIPFFVLTNSRLYDVLSVNENEINGLDDITLAGGIAAVVICLTMVIAGWFRIVRRGDSFRRKDVMLLFILYFAAYIFMSYCVTGVFSGRFLLNHHLYVLNFIVVLVLLRRDSKAAVRHFESKVRETKWIYYFLVVIAIVIALAFLLINIHSDLGGANSRFPNK